MRLYDSGSLLVLISFLGSAHCKNVFSVMPTKNMSSTKPALSADGFRFIMSGPCAINQARLRKYGSSLSSSDDIMGVGGERGRGIAECITDNCDSIPRVEFSWLSPEEEAAQLHGRRDADGIVVPTNLLAGDHPAKLASPFKAYPRCERGAWRPTSGGVINVAVYDQYAAFAGAGCVELHRQDPTGWVSVASLPEELILRVPGNGHIRAGGTLVPERFGTQVAMTEGVLVATGAVVGPSDPPVVVVHSRVGSEWDQVDVLECPGGQKSAACACTTFERFGCFGASLAVHKAFAELVAVGNPQNGSVLIFEQEKGVLAWNLVKVLTSVWSGGLGGNMFGQSVAISGSVLAVGSPTSLASGATIYSLQKGSNFGSLVYDTREKCCQIGLPCCSTALVGVSTSVIEFDNEAYVAVGDPRNTQVHVIKCNTTSIRYGGQDSSCQHTATITPSDDRRGSSRGPDGFGGTVSFGGEAILTGDASRHCSVVDELDACGTVCEVPFCSPDQDFCQGCGSDDDRCEGGLRSCLGGAEDAIGAAILSSLMFLVLFCCVYSLTSWARGGSPASLLCELFCCLPIYRRGSGVFDFGRPGRDRLLSNGNTNDTHDEETESESDDEHEGYIPPEVKEALAASSGVSTSGARGGAILDRDDEKEEGEGQEEEGGEQEGSRRGQSAEEADSVPTEEQEAENAKKQEVAKKEKRQEDSGEGPKGALRPVDHDEEQSVGVSLEYFKCKICFERPIQTVLVPCGHQVMCRKCARQMATCPICRKKVERVQPVFHI